MNADDPRYPPAAGAPGAPFADPNFKLVVLEALRTAKKIDLGTEEQITEHFMGPQFDREEGGHDVLKPAYDYLGSYPLTAQHLAAVEELVFDGGTEIYFYAFPLWDGEFDEFTVASLEGIALLPNLRSIDVCSMLDDCDLSRLAGLNKLETLSLHDARYENADTLLALPALKNIAYYENISLRDPKIKAALEAKGVKVKLFR